jgi:hypothetical protein
MPAAVPIQAAVGSSGCIGGLRRFRVVPRATAEKKRGRWPPRRADQSSNGTPPLTESLRSVPIRARRDSRRAQVWGHSQRAARLGAAQEERVRVRWRGATASGRAAGPARGKTEEGARKGRSLTRGAARLERGRESGRASREAGADRRARLAAREKRVGRARGCWLAAGPRGPRGGREREEWLLGCGVKKRGERDGPRGKGRPKSFCCLLLLLLFPSPFPHLTIPTIPFEFK